MVASKNFEVRTTETILFFVFLMSFLLLPTWSKLHDSVVFFFLPPKIWQKHPSLWSHEDVVPKKCLWNVSLKLQSYLRSLIHLSCCCKSSTWALEAARCKIVFFCQVMVMWSYEVRNMSFKKACLVTCVHRKHPLLLEIGAVIREKYPKHDLAGKTYRALLVCTEVLIFHDIPSSPATCLDYCRLWPTTLFDRIQQTSPLYRSTCNSASDCGNLLHH